MWLLPGEGVLFSVCGAHIRSYGGNLFLLPPLGRKKVYKCLIWGSDRRGSERVVTRTSLLSDFPHVRQLQNLKRRCQGHETSHTNTTNTRASDTGTLLTLGFILSNTWRNTGVEMQKRKKRTRSSWGKKGSQLHADVKLLQFIPAVNHCDKSRKFKHTRDPNRKPS